VCIGKQRLPSAFLSVCHSVLFFLFLFFLVNFSLAPAKIVNFVHVCEYARRKASVRQSACTKNNPNLNIRVQRASHNSFTCDLSYSRVTWFIYRVTSLTQHFNVALCITKNGNMYKWYVAHMKRQYSKLLQDTHTQYFNEALFITQNGNLYNGGQLIYESRTPLKTGDELDFTLGMSYCLRCEAVWMSCVTRMNASSHIYEQQWQRACLIFVASTDIRFL